MPRVPLLSVCRGACCSQPRRGSLDAPQAVRDLGVGWGAVAQEGRWGELGAWWEPSNSCLLSWASAGTAAYKFQSN